MQLLELCFPGQCLAHYIMGSGFIAYAVLMTIIMLVGEQWMRRSGRSPEFYDSWVITLWVCLRLPSLTAETHLD